MLWKRIGSSSSISRRARSLSTVWELYTYGTHLRTFIAAHGYDAVVVHVTTSEAVARHCWQVNRTNSSRRDVSDTDFEDAVRAMEPPTPNEQPILFHSHNEVEIWLETHIARLR